MEISVFCVRLRHSGSSFDHTNRKREGRERGGRERERERERERGIGRRGIERDYSYGMI